MRIEKFAWFILILYGISGIAHAENAYLMDLRKTAKSGNRGAMEFAQTAVINALDDGTHGIDYNETIEQLRRNILAVVGGKRNRDGPLAVASAEVLCRILPWTLGSKNANAEASRELHDIFTKAFPKDKEFARFLDCAHANTTEGYFAFLKDYNYVWPEPSCRYVSVADEQKVGEILNFGFVVLNGLKGSFGSYYRPRLSLRIALLHAALGVYAVKRK